VTYSYFLRSCQSVLTRIAFYAQDYTSRKPVTVNGFVRHQYNCPYRRKCDCFVAIAVRTFGDKVQLFVSGEHTKDSHAEGKGTLTVKQIAAVESSIRSAPLSVGSQVHANQKNFSPGKHVASDRASQAAVNRLVRKHRKELMAARIPGINLDDTEGAIFRLAQSLSLAGTSRNIMIRPISII
jgi:hypothetical protein